MPVRMLFTVLVFVSAIFIMRSSAQAPAATGPFVAGEIIVKFNAEAQKALATQDVKDRLLSQGGVAGGGPPEALAERVKADIAKWGKVVRTAGVKIE